MFWVCHKQKQAARRGWSDDSQIELKQVFFKERARICVPIYPAETAVTKGSWQASQPSEFDRLLERLARVWTMPAEI